MARNRFESYISSPYTSQFVPTPLDANFMFNAMDAKQKYYDTLQTNLAMYQPNVNFLRPNQYDAGHLQEAQGYYDQIEAGKNEIYDLLKNDRLNEAAQRLIGLKTDKNLNQVKQQLEYTYNQDTELRKQFEKIKDPYYRQLSLDHYERSRLENKPFQIGLSLNNPSLLDDPGYQDKINKAMTNIESEGYPLGDGRILKRAYDDKGNPVYKYMSEDGKVSSQITYKEAFDVISNVVGSDPTIQNHLQTAMNMGIDERGNLLNMIDAAARGKAHTKYDTNVSFYDDGLGLHRAKEGATSSGYDYLPYAKNDYLKDRVTVDKDGNISSLTKEYVSGTRAPIYGNVSNKSIPVSEDHPVNKIQEIFYMTKGPNNMSIVLPIDKMTAEQKKHATPLDNKAAAKLYNARLDHMSSLSAGVIPLEKPIDVKVIPTYSNDEDVYVRETGTRGETEYKKMNWGEFKTKMSEGDKIYKESYITALNPFEDVTTGTAYTVTAKDSKVGSYSVIMPDKNQNNTFLKDIKDVLLKVHSDFNAAYSADENVVNDKIINPNTGEEMDVQYVIDVNEMYDNNMNPSVKTTITPYSYDPKTNERSKTPLAYPEDIGNYLIELSREQLGLNQE